MITWWNTMRYTTTVRTAPTAEGFTRGGTGQRWEEVIYKTHKTVAFCEAYVRRSSAIYNEADIFHYSSNLLKYNKSIDVYFVSTERKYHSKKPYSSYPEICSRSGRERDNVRWPILIRYYWRECVLWCKLDGQALHVYRQCTTFKRSYSIYSDIFLLEWSSFKHWRGSGQYHTPECLL